MIKKPFKLKNTHVKQITSAGYAELESRLRQLCVERHEMRQRLHDLREQQASDSYDRSDIMSVLASLNDEIERLRTVLRQVIVIDPPARHKIAQVGAVIHLKDGDKSISYQLVDSLEANPSNGKISSDSPLGRALIGKRINQLVKFVSPKLGTLRYKITKVQ